MYLCVLSCSFSWSFLTWRVQAFTHTMYQCWYIYPRSLLFLFIVLFVASRWWNICGCPTYGIFEWIRDSSEAVARIRGIVLLSFDVFCRFIISIVMLFHMMMISICGNCAFIDFTSLVFGSGPIQHEVSVMIYLAQQCFGSTKLNNTSANSLLFTAHTTY